MDAFKNLPDEKQKIIIDACIDEFAEYGFENASTNRMVRKIGISKGSLFQYFKTKENLYIYVMEVAIGGILKQLQMQMRDLSPDVLERVKKFGETSIDIYSKQPKLFKLFFSLLGQKNLLFQEKLVLIFSRDIESFIHILSRGIDTQNLKWGLETTIEIIKWLLNGIRTDMLVEYDIQTDDEKFKQKYLEKLDQALKVLSEGIYK